MPDGEGFWIRVATAEAVLIDEHCRYASRHPDFFNLTADEIASTGFGGETEGPVRERMLRLVMSKGWIRMRRHSGYIAFQFEWFDQPAAIAAIKAFMTSRPNLVWPTDRIVVTHVDKALVYDGPAARFAEEARIGG